MEKQLKEVVEFQKTFDVVADKVNKLDPQLFNARMNFIVEELNEYVVANNTNDLVGILDALCDIVYFVFGNVVLHGMQDIFLSAFDHVHESNMSKLDNDGNPIYRNDGKVLKSNNFWSPEKGLAKLLLSIIEDEKQKEELENYIEQYSNE